MAISKNSGKRAPWSLNLDSSEASRRSFWSEWFTGAREDRQPTGPIDSSAGPADGTAEAQSGGWGAPASQPAETKPLGSGLEARLAAWLRRDGRPSAPTGFWSHWLSSELEEPQPPAFRAVSTDKDDYGPGEVVTITATGFQVGAAVRFSLQDFASDPGDDGDVDDYGSFVVVDGGEGDLDGEANGTVVAHWTVPSTDDGQPSSTPDALNASMWLMAQEVKAGRDGQLGTADDVGVGPMAINTFTDSVPPTVTISSSDSNLTIGETALITFTFSDDPGLLFIWDETVAATYLEVTGGTLSNFTPDDFNGAIRYATFTPTPGVDAGSASISIKPGLFSDAAGNTSTAAGPLTLAFDTLAPGLSITSNTANLLAGQTATITFTFTEAPAAFGNGNVSVSGGQLSAISATADSRVFTATFTPTAGVNAGTAGISVAAGAYSDGLGNLGAAAALTPDISYDTRVPGLTITSDNYALLAGETALITFTFSEDPGTSFGWDGASGDVVVSGGTLSAITGSGLIRTATFTPDPTAISGSISVAAGTYSDSNGNPGTAAALLTPITFDASVPTLAISANPSSLKAGQTALITFTFSEDPGSSFSWDGLEGDVSVSGGVLSAISGSGLTRTATFTPTPGLNNGTASIAVASGLYNDAAGNPGDPASLSFSFDTLAPGTSIATAVLSGADTGTSASDWITSTAALTVSGTLSQALQDGETVQVSADNGSTWVSATASSGSSSWSYDTPLSGSGTFRARVVDGSGNTGTEFTKAYRVDATAPTLAAQFPVAGATGVQINNSIIFTFSEEIIAAGGQITAKKGTDTGNAIIITLTAGQKTGSFQTGATTGVSGLTQLLTGTWSIAGNKLILDPGTSLTSNIAWTFSIGSGAIQDLAGNSLAPFSSTFTTGSSTDTARPSVNPSAVSFSDDTGASSTDFNTKNAEQTISGTLSGPLAAGDLVQISLNNGTNWTYVDSCATGSSSWSHRATLLAGTNTLRVRVLDAAGNVARANFVFNDNGLGQSYTLDTTPLAAPTLALGTGVDDGVTRAEAVQASGIVQVTGGAATAGRTITVVFQSSVGTVTKTVTSNNATAVAVVLSASDLPFLGSGVVNVSATIEDLAGNISPAATNSFVFDATPPAAVVANLSLSADSFGAGTSGTATDFITKETAQTISGTVSQALAPGEVVRVSVDNGTTWQTATVTAPTNWQLTGVSLSGTNTVVARVQDALGNFSAPLRRAFGLDQAATPNTIALGSGVADGASALEATAAGGVVSVTAEAGAAVSVVFSRSGGGSVSKSLTGNGTAQAVVLTNTDLNTLDDGDITVIATQVDIAGNTATSSTSFRLDRTAPGAPQITTAASTSKVLNHTIRGTAEANARIEVREGSQVLGTTSANAQGQWEALVFLNGQGSHSIQAYATDQAGNRGPTASNAVVITVDVKGSTPTLTKEDLQFMLLQIGIAEAHNTRLGGNAGIRADFVDGSYNVDASQVALRAVLGPGADILPLGLRSVEGINNNLQPNQANFGAADQSFSPATIGATGVPTLPSNYDGDGSGANPSYAYKTASTSGNVTDTHPRLISNLIVDQSTTNPAAAAAAQDQLSLLDPEQQRSANLAALQPQLDPRTGQTIMTVLNVAPNPANAPYNSFLTVFGQGFDHGLDFVDKGGSGTIFVPILPGDPLYSTATGAVNMIMVTRATVDANGNTTNRTTPFIDMNQAYGSHASMQVFLREYIRSGSQTLTTGKLLEGGTGGLPTWGNVKAQALSKLGIRLSDADVSNAPLLVTDEYGRFIPGANGFAQVVVTTGTNAGQPVYEIKEGSEAGLLLTGTGYAAVRTNHAFLLDIAHTANPGSLTAPKAPDGDTAIGFKTADGPSGTTPQPNTQGQYSVYDNELLDAHWIAGDGRVNENTGLTAFHSMFHNEHDRLVDDYKRIAVESGDLTFLNQWLLTPLTAVPTSVAEVAANNWNGERLFQAARFVVEMEYQHSVFEEFARFVDPDVAGFKSYLSDLNPAITREFANVVYRFGHSMLNETIDRFTPDWQNTSQGLIAAFLNPTAFLDPDSNTATTNYTAEQAAGQILRGMTRQQGNAIDEFTTGALRNNLVGLPMDLASINLSRARELGIPRLNQARAEFYKLSNNSQLAPYANWNIFANSLKHFASLINFVAAYGTHAELIKLRDPNTQGSDSGQTSTYLAGFTPETRIALLRSKAIALIDGTHPDSAAFMGATGTYANRRGGVDDIDFWIGGLAEKPKALAGMLGTTFSFVFTQQLQALQNADRLYYLARLGGNLLTQVEQNSFSAMAQRTMDVSSLPGRVFSLPLYTLEVDAAKQLTNLGNGKADPIDANRVNATAADIGYTVDNTIRWNGGHVVLAGSEARDLLQGGRENDTLYGRGGGDVLIGGEGDDQIWGGDGDDFIFDSAGIDVMRGEAGNDVMEGGAALSILYGGTGKDWMVSGTGAGLVGNELNGELGDDFMSASDAGSAGKGGAGDDWFEGNTLGGADKYFLDDGMAGLLNINGNAIPQAVGHDVSISRAGDDIVLGDFGNDIFIDGSGNDDYSGQQGFDWVSFARNGRDPGGSPNNGGAIDLSQIVPAGVLRATITNDLTDLHVEAVGGSQYADICIGDDRTDLVSGNVFLNRNNDLAINGLDRDLVAAFGSLTTADLVLTGNLRNPVVNTHYDLIVDPGTGALVWGVAGGISVNRALDDRLVDLPLDSGGIKGLFSNYSSTAPSGGTFSALIPTALKQTQEVNTRPNPLGTGINIAPVIVNSVPNSSVPGFPSVQGIIDVPAYFNAGNVLIGGAASDRFLAKAGDDVLDGDAWLNVELEWRNPINPTQVVRFADMKAVNDANLVLGLAIKQEDLHIVRELASNPFEADGTTRANDMAIYLGRPDEYLFEGQRRVYVESVNAGILQTGATPIDYQEDPLTGFPINYPDNVLGAASVREVDLNGNLLGTVFDRNTFLGITNNFYPRTTIIGTPTDVDGDGFVTITYAPTGAQLSDPLRGLPPLNQGTDYLRNIETVRFVLPGVANPTGNTTDLLSGLLTPTAYSTYTSRIGAGGATYTYSTFRDGTFVDVDVKGFMSTTAPVLPSVSNSQTPLPDPDTSKAKNYFQAPPALPTLAMRLTTDTGVSSSDNISKTADITVFDIPAGYLCQWSNTPEYYSSKWANLPGFVLNNPSVAITQQTVLNTFGLSKGVNTLYFRVIENKDGGRIGATQAFTFTYDTIAPLAPVQTGVGQTIGTQVVPDPWAIEAGARMFYDTSATGSFTATSQPAVKPYYVLQEDPAGNRGAVAKSAFFYDLQAGRYNDGNTTLPGNNTAGTGYLWITNFQPGERILVDPNSGKYFFIDNYTTADGKTGIGVFKDDGTGTGGKIASAIPGSWDGRDELLALIQKEALVGSQFTPQDSMNGSTVVSTSYGVDPTKMATTTFSSTSTRDNLTGQAGVVDTFKLASLSHALLPTVSTNLASSFDRITNLNTTEDLIDSPFVRYGAIKPTVNTKAVTALTTTAISAVLTKSTFVANGAATFVFGTGTVTRTFLALGDATAGFGANDAVIEITGVTGPLSSLSVF